MNSWSTMFPRGRHIYYEGDDPIGFREEIKARFKFDPGLDEHWGIWIPKSEGCEGFWSYSFHCPSEYLDVIYDRDNYPMGS